MKKILSFILALSLLVSFVGCGEYNEPIDNKQEENEEGGEGGNTEQGGTEQRGEPFVATVMLGGKPYVPPKASDDSEAVKVRWTNGKSYQTVNLGNNGSAECYGLDGEYSVSVLNLPDGYTYNPNIYTTNNNNRNTVIELMPINPAYGKGTDVMQCIELTSTGVYRTVISESAQEVFYEFRPTKAGRYYIESMMDVSAEMYNPILDIYSGTFAYKIREKRVDDGGISKGYTTNFKHIVEIDEKFIGNVYTFAVFVEGKDATYPVNVDFKITYEGDYTYDWIISNFVYPTFIPNYLTPTGAVNSAKFDEWYESYTAYLAEDRAKFGDGRYNMASVKIDGKNVFDANYVRLNPEDGYYHVYDEVKYAAYGGWGPILYANITIPTNFIDSAFNTIEYAGNKNLTVSQGTENYKLFIEGYDRLTRSDSSYFCILSCECLKSNGGCCTVEQNCTKCTDDCRHIQAKYKYQKGYSDIAIDGRCPVTEELMQFLQKYSVSQKLFSDGNGWAEQSIPRYDAYEDSQWLFACGYYSN